VAHGVCAVSTKHLADALHYFGLRCVHDHEMVAVLRFQNVCPRILRIVVLQASVAQCAYGLFRGFLVVDGDDVRR